MAKNKKVDRPFVEIFSMMNKPTEFFSREHSIIRGFIYFILSDAIFTSLTQTMVFYGILPATLKTSFFMSIVINFFSIIAGFMLISAVLIFINLIAGGKNQFQLFATMLYSIVPALLFGWIPFIFVQFITLFWSMALIMTGVGSAEKFNYKKSLMYPIIFIALVFAITIISQNYIFLGFLK